MRTSETSTAINLAADKIAAAVSRVRFFGLSSDSLHTQVRDVLAGMFSGKIAPKWARGYLVGYYHALRADLYQRDLFYGRRDGDGRLWADLGHLGQPRALAAELAGHDVRNLESFYGGTFSEWKTWTDGHYWKPSKDYPRALATFHEGRSPPGFRSIMAPGLLSLVHGPLVPSPRRVASQPLESA